MITIQKYTKIAVIMMHEKGKNWQDIAIELNKNKINTLREWTAQKLQQWIRRSK